MTIKIWYNPNIIKKVYLINNIKSQIKNIIYNRIMPKRTRGTYVSKLDVPEEKLSEYREAFDMFDKDHSGSISVDEISKIMKNFGNPMTKDEIKEMIKDIDTSGDGELDFEEFVTLMQKQEVVVEDDDDEVIRAFKSFDKDQSGKISNMEFRYILTQLGEKFTDSEVDTLFKECDLDNDGVLNYEEFVAFWRSI